MKGDRETRRPEVTAAAAAIPNAPSDRCRAPRTAFRAELAAVDFGTGVFHVTATLPALDWDAYSKMLGPPSRPNDGDPADVRSVALLACRTPRHPESDADVLAIAAADALIHALSDGTFVLSPAMLLRIGIIAGHISKRGLFRTLLGPAEAPSDAAEADHGL